MPPENEVEQLRERVDELERALSILIRSDRYTFQKDLELLDGRGLIGGKSTGMYIGTATDEKIGLYGTTPVVQATTAIGQIQFTENSGNQVRDDSVFGGYTLQQIVQAIKNIGIIA